MTETGREANGEVENFFTAGHKSYVDALLALREYHRLVFKVSREVLESQLSAFAKALGQKFGKLDIKPGAFPKDIFTSDYNGWEAWLGASVGIPLTLSMGMSICKEDGRYVPTAAVELSPERKDEYYSSLCKACGEAADATEGLKYRTEDYDIGLSMTFESLDDFRNALETVSGHWLVILKKAKRRS